ncbi:TonB-dependent receptor [Capnocytophaga sp. ARDL2]|uniref:TonB-dependent receptor n=1 Tax=Capnocytophaga sp. ARDL2 TaxID=3238809 RepID=UPI0035560A8B
MDTELILPGDRVLKHQHSIRDKALKINLNKNIYGSFSEIGAGQETARHFFRAGAASRTIAKTMSAYDKQFSDAIYTTEADGRYVTETRLRKMLDYEFNLLLDRIDPTINPERYYFSFANTVATIDFAKKFKGHGWLGVKFQTCPGEKVNEIVVHVQFKENDANLQQQTLGILGVNLIYGAFYYNHSPKKLIDQLYDHLDTDQIEIDTINFSGPCFEKVDNRLMSLYLVKSHMTEAVMFSPDAKNVLPANVLFKKNVLILRGSFRPVTTVNINMYKKSLDLFLKENNLSEENTQVIFEITLYNLLKQGDLDENDFLSRAELLCALGYTVMVSNFKEYFKVIDYCSQYSQEFKALTIGVNSLYEIFNERHYHDLSGGVLEGLGRLFKDNLKIYLYPIIDKKTEEITSSKNLKLTCQDMQPFYEYFVNKKQIIDIENYEFKNLKIFSQDVLDRLKNNDESWKTMVPDEVAEIIEKRNLFRE